MKNTLTFLLFLSANFCLPAQVQNPVTWKARYTAISASEGELIFYAAIDKNWHMYSQRPTDAGPIPTSFTFTPSRSYQLVGKTEETEAHEEFVPAFEAKIFVFKDVAEFRQKIKLTGKPGFIVAVKLEYMTCNDMMCLPPKTIELPVKIQ
ncbi:MAG: protein-disulfide reductase DsbD family protein [bacterium]|nr:protein-disulfide reductase DsbD family protein [bacterium]